MASVSKFEKSKAQKRRLEEDDTHHSDSVKPTKITNKKFAKEEPSENSKQAWLHEKAAQSVIPKEEDAQLLPARIFKGLDPLIVHMCTPCKKFNADRESEEISDGMVQLPLALCTVCRAHLNTQKSIKFFQHDCPSIKKMLNLYLINAFNKLLRSVKFIFMIAVFYVCKQ